MNVRLLPAVLILLLASACTVYREYPIEVFHPGEVFLPAPVKSAAVVYRQFKYPEDTLLHYFTNDFQLYKAKNDPADLDSLLVTVCLNELATNLKANEAFDELHVFPYHTFERHSGEHLTDLPAELIAQITTASDANLLILLETFSLFFSAYPETFDTPATNEVISVAVWGVYDPLKKATIERKTMIDTVYWNGYNEEGNCRQNYRPPARLTALELAAAMAGESYAKRFYPSWQTVSRMYSVPPLPDFSEAAHHFEEGEWDKAIALWQKYADDRNGKMAINARYNLALVFEMKDDLETAAKWLAAACDLAQKHRSRSDLQMIEAYRKVLEKRRTELSKFNRLQNESLP